MNSTSAPGKPGGMNKAGHTGKPGDGTTAGEVRPSPPAPARPGNPVVAGRHIYGPRPLGALLPDLVRPAFRKRSPAAAQIMADWEAIMGPEIGRTTVPRKLFSGTLSIVCPGHVAMELQHVSTLVIERINGHLGRVAVTRLRFIQDVFAPPPALSHASPPRATQAAAAAVSELPQGDLRDALERLGRVVLTGR